MSFNGLDRVFLEINSLEESLAFYKNILGLELHSQNLEAEAPIATLLAGNVKITLAQQFEALLKRGRGVHFVFSVSDVEAYYGRLKSSGVDLAPPTDEGWGGRLITLLDPDGYRLHFVEWHIKPTDPGE